LKEYSEELAEAIEKLKNRRTAPATA
jgi:hypothetical protein